MLREEKLFVYGTLIDKYMINQLIEGHGEVIKVEPAVVNGKMYSYPRIKFPIVLKMNEGRKAKSPCHIYGALVTLMTDDFGIKMLDAYEGCSKSIIGTARDTDLYRRERIDVRKIHFKTIDDFINYNFTTEKETTRAWIYLGNLKHEIVSYCCEGNNDARAGNVWRTFFNIFS